MTLRDLPGRHEALERVLASDRPVVVLAGGPSAGRSTLLAEARARLGDLPSILLRVTRAERNQPGAIAARLAQELAADRTDLQWDLRQLFATPVRVFLDDVQWMDPESLAPILAALRGTPARIVAACRLPAPPGPLRAAFGRLTRDEQAEVVTLRPLDLAATKRLLTGLLRAEPDADLVTKLHRQTRGVPGALMDAVEGYRRADSLRTVDRYAFLTPADRPPEGDLPVLRQLGEPAWPVAKALAVLHPLGPAAPRLVAEATGLPDDTVSAAVRALRAEGVLRPHALAFRVPVLADLLISCLGPYERRRLAQLAVTTVWSGTAAVADPHYLPERLVDAGGLIDAERSGRELLGHAHAAAVDFGHLAKRWSAAAAERLAEPAQARFLHAAVCGLHRCFPQAAASSRAALSEDLPAEALQELGIVHIVALLGIGDVESLRAIAEGDKELPGGLANAIVGRAAALSLLDRWAEADELLVARRAEWMGAHPAATAYGLTFGGGAGALRGRLTEFEESLKDPVLWPVLTQDQHRVQQLSARARILMVFGELQRAEVLLAQIPARQLTPAERATQAGLAGQWDRALQFARFTTATGAADGYPPANTVMSRELAKILAARGRFGRARTVLDRARTSQPLLTHVLDLAQAEVEFTLGNTERALELLTGALDQAAGQDVVLGCEELWLTMTEWQVGRGALDAARRAGAEIGRIAERTGTGRARLNHLLATMLVDGDRAVADEALELARERGQTYELATTLTTVVRRGAGDGKLLMEAYELFGELDALVPRAHVRNLMRTLDVAVPGRAATVAENERLLSVLVAEGLTNRELAMVLQTTEKSVEGRLTRLFQRSGYRSRVELAAALLTGEHPS